MVANFHRLKRNVIILHDIILHGSCEIAQRQHRRIDIWIRHLRANGGLMLVLACLMQSSLTWRGAEIRLILLV